MTLSKADQAKKQAEKEQTQAKSTANHKRGLAEIEARDKWAQEHPKKVILQRLKSKDYDLDLNERMIIASFKVAAVQMLECGRLLLERKANTKHGDFTEWLDEVWPTSKSIAYYWMKLALRVEANPHLKTYIPALTRAGKGKMYDLLSLPEEDMIAICEGEGNGEIKCLDDVSAMSRKELQQQMRKGREQLSKADEDGREKDRIIDELKEENLTLKVGPKTDREHRRKLAAAEKKFCEATIEIAELSEKTQTQWQARASYAGWQFVDKFFCISMATSVQGLTGEARGEYEDAVSKPDGVEFFSMDSLVFEMKRTADANEEAWGEADMTDVIKSQVEELHFNPPKPLNVAEETDNEQDETE